jgi:hypothetical protein
MAKDDERRAAALRENLRRRKAQGRGRLDQERADQQREVPPEAGGDTAPPVLPDRAPID